MILTASKAANETATFKLDHSHVIVFTMLYQYVEFSKTNKIDSGGAIIFFRGERETPEGEGCANLLFCNYLHYL